jgi:hypothetical protein
MKTINKFKKLLIKEMKACPNFQKDKGSDEQHQPKPARQYLKALSSKIQTSQSYMEVLSHVYEFEKHLYAEINFFSQSIKIRGEEVLSTVDTHHGMQRRIELLRNLNFIMCIHVPKILEELSKQISLNQTVTIDSPKEKITINPLFQLESKEDQAVFFNPLYKKTSPIATLLFLQERLLISPINYELEGIASSEAPSYQIKSSYEKEADFLVYVKEAIILSFLKALLTESGQHLICKLAKTFSLYSHSLLIRAMLTPEPYSLTTIPKSNDKSSYTTSSLDSDQSLQGSLYERTKPIKQPKEKGSSSILCFPVWSKDLSFSDFHLIYGAYFHDADFSFCLSNIIMGSLSFNQEDTAFYTPMHIEFIHELIHVLHNSRGTNRKELDRQLTEEERNLWSNTEEYWTIEGGHLCENRFNRELLPPVERLGHRGAPLTDFFKIKPASRKIEQLHEEYQASELK